MDAYKAPESTVAEEQKGSKIKAIVVGMLIDYGLTIVASVVAGVVLSAIFVNQGVVDSELEQKVTTALISHEFPLISYPLIVFCMFASFLGGYYAAKIANDKEYILAGVLSVMTILLSILNSNAGYSLFESIGYLVVNVAVIFLGAFVHVRNKNATE